MILKRNIKTFFYNLGGFKCYCWEGFEGTGVFGDCHNIDECSYYEMADGGEGLDYTYFHMGHFI